MMTDKGVTVTGLANTMQDESTTISQPVWLIPAYLVVSITGLLGNSLVILIISSVRKMQTVTNFFILHQSVIDLASAALMLVILLSEAAVPAEYSMPPMACKLWFSRYPVWSCFMASTINLVTLTMERYHAILHPLHHSRVFSQTRVLRFFPICWVAGFALLSYLIFMSSVIDDRHCLLGRFDSDEFQLALGICTVTLYYLVPLSVMVFAYSSILREVRRQRWVSAAAHNRPSVVDGDGRSQVRVEKNVLKVLALVVVVYGVCWSPNQILYFYFCLGGYLDFSSSFYHWTVVMVTANMCVNPFVYALKYQSFREAMSEVLCRRRSTAVNVISGTQGTA